MDGIRIRSSTSPTDGASLFHSQHYPLRQHLSTKKHPSMDIRHRLCPKSGVNIHARAQAKAITRELERL